MLPVIAIILGAVLFGAGLVALLGLLVILIYQGFADRG